MKTLKCRFVFICFALVFISHAFAQNSTLSITKPFLEAQSDSVSEILSEYNYDIFLKTVSVFALVLLGAVITLLHGIRYQKREEIKKNIAMIIGIIITVVSTLDATLLKYDVNISRQYKHKTLINRNDMDNYIKIYNTQNETLVSKAVGALYEKIKDDYYEYQKYKTSGSGGAKLSLISPFVPSAFGQSLGNRPSWLMKKPFDRSYIFSIGIGESDNFSAALDSAVSNGRKYLIENYNKMLKNNPSTQDNYATISEYVASKAAVVDKYTTINSENTKIIAYVLLRLEKYRIDNYLNIFELKNNKKLANKNAIDRIIQNPNF